MNRKISCINIFVLNNLIENRPSFLFPDYLREVFNQGRKEKSSI